MTATCCSLGKPIFQTHGGCFRIVDLAGKILAPSLGLDSLFSPHPSHSKAKHLSFFHKPSDPTAVDCISAIPWHTQKNIHKSLRSCTHLIVHSTPSFPFFLFPQWPLCFQRLIFQLADMGNTPCSDTVSLPSQLLPSSRLPSFLSCHTSLGYQSTFTYLAFITMDARRYAMLLLACTRTHIHRLSICRFNFSFFFTWKGYDLRW